MTRGKPSADLYYRCLIYPEKDYSGGCAERSVVAWESNPNTVPLSYHSSQETKGIILKIQDVSKITLQWYS
jgi:hypothetical protein